MKLFARPTPTKDHAPELAELRSRLKTVEADKQKARDDAEMKTCLLVSAEGERDRLLDRVERHRIAMESLTAERDKALEELVAVRTSLMEQNNELRQRIDAQRKEIESALRVSETTAVAYVKRDAILAEDCEQALGAIKNALVVLGK